MAANIIIAYRIPYILCFFFLILHKIIIIFTALQFFDKPTRLKFIGKLTLDAYSLGDFSYFQLLNQVKI